MASYKPKSLAQKIVELEDPAPRDYDPEDVGLYNSSDESENWDKPDGREHYQAVEKSKLRKPQEVPFGPAYRGSRVSRSAFNDSDDDGYHTQSGSEEESVESILENGENGVDFSEEETEEELDEELGIDEDEDDDEDEDEHLEMSRKENDDSDEDEDFDGENDNVNSVINKPMTEIFHAMDLKTVAKSLSEAVAKDVEKGNAIRSQRAAFDSLLNVRIRLQKALISINSLPEAKIEQPNEATKSANEALDAAVNLLNTITSIRNSFDQFKESTKRKHAEMDSSSSMTDIWDQIKEQERRSKKIRNTTLNFWSSKLRPQQGEKRLTGVTQQSLTDVLSGQLASDMSRLVERTQMPRSCAPVQAKLGTKSSTQNELPLYDDADFYGLLLQSLITQRGSDATVQSAMNVSFPTQPWQAAREAKYKKNVDTKASKGRRLRYTVHEKIQDLMPRDDRTTWTERQCDELFASILGRKIELQAVESEEENDADLTEFRLF